MVDNGGESSFLIGYGLFNPTTILAAFAVISLMRKDEDESV